MIINYTHITYQYILKKHYENRSPIVVGYKRKKVKHNILKIIKQYLRYIYEYKLYV